MILAGRALFFLSLIRKCQQVIENKRNLLYSVVGAHAGFGTGVMAADRAEVWLSSVSNVE